jgi:hypothetical protein
MIKRLLRTGVTLLVYFCAATLLAQVIIFAYLWSTWQLNREKVIQMLAIAQGIDLLGAQEDFESGQDTVPPEQLSYQDWIDQRATMFRDLELREQALNKALSRLKFGEQQLADDQRKNKQMIVDFEARLLALSEGAEAEGRQAISRILESLKPAQAKDLILRMLDNDEIDEVVVIIGEMAERKRASILGQFKTEPESEKISEVLRLLREGEPVDSTIGGALGQMSESNPTGY